MTKLFICMLSLTLFIAPASALTISMQSGPNSFACSDGDGCDNDPASGVVSATTNLGGAVVSLNSAGTGFPALGSPTLPDVDLLTAVTTDGAQDVNVRIGITQSGFGGFAGITPFTLAIGGTTRGSVGINAYADGNNTDFGTAALLASLGPFSGPAFSDTVSAQFAHSGLYSLTLFADIFHPAGSRRISSFNAEFAATAVPEPATLGLFGVGLILLSRKLKR